MFKFLQLILLSSMFYLNSFSADSIIFDNDIFLNAYLDAVINKDISKYESLLLSKTEMEYIVNQFKINSPNCITDNEINYNPKPFLKQFEDTDFKALNINSYKILYNNTMAGCGKSEGLKILLELKKDNEPVQNRTLILIKIKDNYKLLFDLASNNN